MASPDNNPIGDCLCNQYFSGETCEINHGLPCVALKNYEMRIVDSCHFDGTLTLTFQWLSSCSGGYCCLGSLPPEDLGVCKYMTSGNLYGLVATILGICGIILNVMLAVFVLVQRNTPVIKASQPFFGVAICVGGVCLNISSLLFTVPLSDEVCIGRSILLYSGSSILLVAIFVKSFRVWKICK